MQLTIQGIAFERSDPFRPIIIGGIMAVIKNAKREQVKNVLLRISIPVPLMAEVKKTNKLCKDNGFYFNIKPDVVEALTKAVEEAKELVNSEKNIK
jgi:hypothetical protein